MDRLLKEQKLLEVLGRHEYFGVNSSTQEKLCEAQDKETRKATLEEVKGIIQAEIEYAESIAHLHASKASDIQYHGDIRAAREGESKALIRVSACEELLKAIEGLE